MSLVDSLITAPRSLKFLASNSLYQSTLDAEIAFASTIYQRFDILSRWLLTTRSPNTALLIKDETRNVFYELEDPRDVQDRCVIKIYCKEPIYGTYPGHPHLANGDLRVRTRILCVGARIFFDLMTFASGRLFWSLKLFGLGVAVLGICHVEVLYTPPVQTCQSADSTTLKQRARVFVSTSSDLPLSLLL